MGFTSRLLFDFGPASALIKAILFSLLGIVLLIGFIILRRWYRGRYLRRLSHRAYTIRARWDDIISGNIPFISWRLKKMDCSIVEAALLDKMETAEPEEVPKLLRLLRESGLLEMRILEARYLKGWSQRTALVALGRTRTPEVVPVLANALDSGSQETRIAAARGLGCTGLLEAAVPLLDRFVSGQLRVPGPVLKNALAACCHSQPAMLLSYLDQAKGADRELLARVLGELAGPESVDEVLTLSVDESPEVRASAARALGHTRSSTALSTLAALASDPEWFVRLRAVVSLGLLEHPGRIKPLLGAVCDSNRHVRQRAAWSLARAEGNLDEILEQIISTNDKYALQAFISELERSGTLESVTRLLDINQTNAATKMLLLEALTDGKKYLEKAALASSAVAGAH